MIAVVHAEGDGGVGVDVGGVHVEELPQHVVVERGTQRPEDVAVGVVELIRKRGVFLSVTVAYRGTGTEAEALDVEGVLKELVFIDKAEMGRAAVGVIEGIVAHLEGDDAEPFADLRRGAGGNEQEEGEEETFHSNWQLIMDNW